jgi:hypothetical protein
MPLPPHRLKRRKRKSQVAQKGRIYQARGLNKSVAIRFDESGAERRIPGRFRESRYRFQIPRGFECGALRRFRSVADCQIAKTAAVFPKML